MHFGMVDNGTTSRNFMREGHIRSGIICALEDLALVKGEMPGQNLPIRGEVIIVVEVALYIGEGIGNVFF